MIALRADGIHAFYGKSHILHGISLEVREGEIVALLGRNGAGKTTTLRAIMGLLPAQGAVSFAGTDLLRLPTHRRAGLGIGYMPEDRRLVPVLSVEENVLLPSWATRDPETKARLAFVYELMPEVAAMRTRKAQLLSGGQQKLVALARALSAGRRLLLLDEPFEGVAPALSQRLAEVIAALKGTSLAVLIAQSDLNHSAKLLDREYLIERGANRARVAAAAAPG
jgi:branched-chain amino acid transport system ATP-binding protein